MDDNKIPQTLEIGFGQLNSKPVETPCDEILQGADSVISGKLLTEDCNAHANIVDSEVSPSKLSGDDLTCDGVTGNVFDEVFGPLDGFDENGDDSSNKVDQEDANEAGMFNVGDLVWAKSRAGLYWPGSISDPSCNAASKDLIRSTKKEGCFLVKYFGNPSPVWCSLSDMKPFIEYFDEMSRQNKSKSFIISVDKALSAIGQHVKCNMTCRCIAKETQPTNVQLSTEKLSVKEQFEPSSFLERIRGLACTGSAPGKVELVVMKNCLSPFYRSIGHCELSPQMLKPSNESYDDEVLASPKKKMDRNTSNIGDSSGKGSESSRPRKKSKYLSYPYAPVEKEIHEPKATPPATSSRRGTKKNLTLDNHVIIKADDKIDASSAELLSELYSTARDYCYLRKSKYSESVKRFYCSFRVFSFLDVKIACEQIGKESNNAESENETLDFPSVEDGSVDNKKSEKDNLKAKGKSTPRKKAVKKKEAVVSVSAQMEGIENVGESEIVKLDIEKGSDIAENDKKVESDTPKRKGNSTPRKKLTPRKKKVEMPTGVLMEAKVGESESMKLDLEKGSDIADIDKNMECDTLDGKGNATPRNKATPKKKKVEIPTGVLMEAKVEESEKPTFRVEGSDNASNNQIFEKDVMKEKGNVVGSTIYPNGSSYVISFGQTPQLPQIVEPNFSGSPSFSIEQGKSLHGKISEGMLFPNMSGTDQTPGPLLKNIQQVNNGVSIIDTSTTKFPSSGSIFSGPDSKTISFGLTPPPIQSPIGPGPLLSCSGKRGRKRKETISQVPSPIPDLNGNIVNPISPESSNVKVNVVQDLGGGLLLKFAPDFPLPSKETLISTFSRFGLVKESEILVLDESTTQIMYERSSDATFAFRSLQKGSPFGASLVSFNLHQMPDGSSVVKVKKRRVKQPVPLDGSATPRKLKMPLPPGFPVDGNKSVAKAPNDTGPPPDIEYIRQNVEMMKAALEKAGDSLSPEMRVKLENEIKGFLDKIGSMGGGSSSS